MKIWGGRRTLLIVPAAVLALFGLLFACGSQVNSLDEAVDPGPEPAVKPVVHVVPGDTARNISPEDRVVVRVQHGTLASVDVAPVRGDGRALRGETTEGGQRWESAGPLALDTRYSVTVEARGERGKTTHQTSTFSTLTPKRTVEAHVSPLEGETVGVGMPVIIYFTEPVRNRAAVERRLEVENSGKDVEGSWYWMDNEELHYRPREYWPANTDVSVNIPLRGVDAGAGVWGVRNRVISFHVGDSIVSHVDVDRHTMAVDINGKRARTIPVSTGKAGFLTRGGTKVVLSKERVRVMDASTIGISPGSSDYYRLRVEYAVRVTWSGEFVHSAPWSVGSQGSANVSHGCVGMSPSNAIWFYNMAKRGDIVRVTGSPRPMELRNGYGDWNLSWKAWQKGSALH